MEVEVRHEGHLGEMGWTRNHWRQILGPKPWKLYVELRQERYDGAIVDLRRLAAVLGMSWTKLQAALDTLQRAGFISVED